MIKMNELFDEWKKTDLHVGERFIEDGVIDDYRWNKSKLKVMFLLKEAYWTDNWDKSQPLNLCEHIKKWNGLKYKIWHTVAQWAYGLSKLAETGDVNIFPEKENFKDDWGRIEQEVIEAFLSSSIVNIKKSCGGPSSDNDDLMKYVKEDWGRILRQVKLINPDIIICGSTWWGIIKKHLDDTDLKYEKISEWVYKYEEMTFVDFWHPANHYPSKLNYYSLCTAVRLSEVLPRFR